MSYRAELANAARWISAAVSALPPEHRPDIALEWGELLERLQDCGSDGSRELAIIEWREQVAERLAPPLSHAPHEEVT
jgi:hypothetical protein